jgi:hypothetical protein
MKRSLLTMFVRAGMVYDPIADNYEEALFSEKWSQHANLAKATKIAVMRFLFGFTKYVGPTIEDQPTIESHGWHRIFEGLSEQSVKQYLIWPNKNAYIPKSQIEAICI